MNSDDYYRIRALADAGGYGYSKRSSAFKLPDVDHYHMYRALVDAIDWHRLFSDFVNRILSKLGSFASDWHFGYQYTLCYIIVTQPGLDDEDVDSCDFVRMQNIVQRLFKVKASGPVFQVDSWREFPRSVTLSGRLSDPLERGTHPRMSDVQFAATVRENERRGCFHGKFPLLRFLIDSMIEDHYRFELDDLIALHRGGVYTLPGRRVDLSWLQYAN